MTDEFLLDKYQSNRGCFNEKTRKALKLLFEANTIEIDGRRLIKTITPEQLEIYFKKLD